MHLTLLSVFVLGLGVFGWTANIFYRAVVIYCDFNEGLEIDWGKQIFLTVLIPIGYLFPMLEIVLIYG